MINTNSLTPSILGISHLSLEAQEQIIADMSHLLVQAVLVEVSTRLKESQHDEFASLAEGDDPEKLLFFLNEHLPDLQEIIDATTEKEISLFREQIKAA